MLIGVLGVAAALAAGHLVAAFIDPNASPFLAVGNAAIDLTPSWLKEFAVSSFGTADKLVLLTGMAVFLLVVAGVAGLLSRRNPIPGAALAVVLGGAAIVAVFSRSDLGQLATLAPLASLVAGVMTFRRLHAAALRVQAAGNAPDSVDSLGHDRRTFLLGSVGVAAGAGVAGLAGQLIGTRVDVEGSRAMVTQRLARYRDQATAPGADFAQDGTPTYLTSNDNFYRIDTALSVPRLRAEDWSLRIHGLVDRELTLTFDDVMDMDLITRTVTMTCVSDEVGGPYISTAPFTGVLLRDLLAKAGVKPGADQVFSTSVDGYTAGSPLEVIMDKGSNAMLAVGMNGEALPPEHGFPVRLVVPGLYGYVSATKWVTDIELTTFAAKTQYWVPRGYSAKAPIKTESRIDSPRGQSSVPAGKVTVAGIAWAQTKGIAKVELQMDGGQWQEADLATQPTKEAWRMWRHSFDVRPGTHTVVVRATDATGYTQTADLADPVPDGATGLHSVVFTAA
ncbi:molybdopterin-dependent oxidoreductase [Kutzneria sp. CA-103260]|uniref:molybdopterin-dependent oxidoreductase n=1 Tax=Kutzneria sp. CA-103260 TaxID=2802641 RepID=UPI001BA998C7|nr:molybdopterin-dependent oxidoreductase [Kutzneria sp. CA-103260]QUQ70482.1 molybdopterin binding domain-containing oxidoreductase [Kutzneria sp. CA-103260]